jgi:hypothetical protein
VSGLILQRHNRRPGPNSLRHKDEAYAARPPPLASPPCPHLHRLPNPDHQPPRHPGSPYLLPIPPTPSRLQFSMRWPAALSRQHRFISIYVTPAYFNRSCTLQLRDLRHVAARHHIPICVTPPSRPYSSRPARCNSVTYDTWQLAALPPPTTPRPCMVNCEHTYPAQSSRAPDRGGGYTALVNHSPTISLHLQQ